MKVQLHPPPTREEILELMFGHERMVERLNKENPLNIAFLAATADAMIRTLHCSDRDRFIEIWGPEKGPYLWEKFLGKSENEADFLCYLDAGNQAALAEWAVISPTNGLAELFPTQVGMVLQSKLARSKNGDV